MMKEYFNPTPPPPSGLMYWIGNYSPADRMIMATDQLNERLCEIMAPKYKNVNVSVWVCVESNGPRYSLGDLPTADCAHTYTFRLESHKRSAWLCRWYPDPDIISVIVIESDLHKIRFISEICDRLLDVEKIKQLEVCHDDDYYFIIEFDKRGDPVYAERVYAERVVI